MIDTLIRLVATGATSAHWALMIASQLATSAWLAAECLSLSSFASYALLMSSWAVRLRSVVRLHVHRTWRYEGGLRGLDKADSRSERGRKPYGFGIIGKLAGKYRSLC